MFIVIVLDLWCLLWQSLGCHITTCLDISKPLQPRSFHHGTVLMQPMQVHHRRNGSGQGRRLRGCLWPLPAQLEQQVNSSRPATRSQFCTCMRCKRPHLRAWRRLEKCNKLLSFSIISSYACKGLWRVKDPKNMPSYAQFMFEISLNAC